MPSTWDTVKRQTMKRLIYFISDSTGITAETLGHSLLSQFSGLEFDMQTIPFVETTDNAQSVVKLITQTAVRYRTQPIIFATLINQDLRAVFEQADAVFIDLFNTFISPLETAFDMRASSHAGLSHGVVDPKSYDVRIDAINFALNHDDGVAAQNYDKADLILVGVSRSGKTPTCSYMALQFGIRMANYPITEEDLPTARLPKPLLDHQTKLFGLTIAPERLQHIRHARRAHSQYALLERCQQEVKAVEQLYQENNISFLNTTTFSIEEIAAKILAETGIKRRLR